MFKSRKIAPWALVISMTIGSFGIVNPAVATTLQTESSVDLATLSADAPEVPGTVAAAGKNRQLAKSGTKCEEPAEGEATLCITQELNSPAARSQEVPLAPASIVPLPEWCLDAGVQDAGSFLATRTSACSISSYTLDVWETIGGVRTTTGTMKFLTADYVYMTNNLPGVKHQISVMPTSITGTAVGIIATGDGACWGACTSSTSSFSTQVLLPDVTAEGDSDYLSTATTPGSIGNTVSTWTMTFKAPGTTAASELETQSPLIRCDTAVPGTSTTGCVVPDITPSIDYSGGWGEFQTHVQGAQASGLPGGSDLNPLHRLVDSTLQTSNRNKACPASYPRPSGKTCDEYPFASTMEGAFTGGGTARTQPWCQISLTAPPSTGPTGYSVCMIDGALNSLAGSVMQSVLFVPMRVLDGDAFVVSFS